MTEFEPEIRHETLTEYKAIEQVIINAFLDHPHSTRNEHLILQKLREQNDLVAGLVAVVGQSVVGHIAFSKILIEDQFCDWYLLAPLAVAPSFQRVGIGSKLVMAGLDFLKENRTQGCLLVGDPQFYGRFGFHMNPNIVLPEIPAQYVLSLHLHGAMPKGRVTLPPAFTDS